MSDFPPHWNFMAIGDFASRVRRKNEGGVCLDPMTISAVDGLVSQRDYFKKIVASKNTEGYTLLHKNDFAYNKSYSEGYPVGAARRLKSKDIGIVSPLYICFELDEIKIDLRFADYLFDSDWFVQAIYGIAKEGARSHGLLNIGIEEFFSASMPIPPLPEQKNIAEILSGIDSAILKLKTKSKKLDALQNALSEKFAADLHTELESSALEENAEVRTGVAKNSKSEGDMIDMPYMRVANVQDGYLDLSEIKVISIDRHRTERYLLRKGDVLINEGGDLDKVGRGVIWNDEIRGCLHQNHVFAVRCSERLMPEFLSLYLKTSYSKNYFLGCAKQTTNLASINSTQLKSFPIPIPHLQRQVKFIEHITSSKNLSLAIATEISGLEAMKKAISDDLLSGRKRVTI